MKALVVFYSRTGTTRKIAKQIENLLKCDSEEIHDAHRRAGLVGWLRASRDSESKKLTRLRRVYKDPAAYDIVIIGTPIWNHTISTPIRTYCIQYKDSFKKAAFFCTRDSTDDSPFKEMESLCGKKPVSTLRLHRRQQVETNQYIEKVEQFTEIISTSLAF